MSSNILRTLNSYAASKVIIIGKNKISQKKNNILCQVEKIKFKFQCPYSFIGPQTSFCHKLAIACFHSIRADLSKCNREGRSSKV